jgi:hypothetical protein
MILMHICCPWVSHDSNTKSRSVIFALVNISIISIQFSCSCKHFPSTSDFFYKLIFLIIETPNKNNDSAKVGGIGSDEFSADFCVFISKWKGYHFPFCDKYYLEFSPCLDWIAAGRTYYWSFCPNLVCSVFSKSSKYNQEKAKDSCYAKPWSIWCEMNKIVFDNVYKPIQMVVDQIRLVPSAGLLLVGSFYFACPIMQFCL